MFFGGFLNRFCLSVCSLSLAPRPRAVLPDGTQLVDFGLGVTFSNEDETFHQDVGSLYYVAPEVLGRNYTKVSAASRDLAKPLAALSSASWGCRKTSIREPLPYHTAARSILMWWNACFGSACCTRFHVAKYRPTAVSACNPSLQLDKSAFNVCRLATCDDVCRFYTCVSPVCMRPSLYAQQVCMAGNLFFFVHGWTSLASLLMHTYTSHVTAVKIAARRKTISTPKAFLSTKPNLKHEPKKCPFVRKRMRARPVRLATAGASG